MLKYTDTTPDTYIQSWTVTEIMAREVWKYGSCYTLNWLPNSYWKWQEYVVSVMLISVLNIKVTCEWHKAIKLKYKNIRTRVIVILRVRSTIHDPGMLLTPGYRKQKFSNMTPHARTDIDYGQLTRIVRATSRCPHFSLAIISVTVQLWT